MLQICDNFIKKAHKDELFVVIQIATMPLTGVSIVINPGYGYNAYIFGSCAYDNLAYDLVDFHHNILDWVK